MTAKYKNAKEAQRKRKKNAKKTFVGVNRMLTNRDNIKRRKAGQCE